MSNINRKRGNNKRFPSSLLTNQQTTDFEGVGSLYSYMLHLKEEFAPLAVMDIRRKYPHRKARLVKGKRWYLNFGVWDDTAQKIITKKWYKGFSELETEKEKLAWAQKNIRKCNEIIAYTCTNKRKVEPKKDVQQRKLDKITMSIPDAFQYILDLKYREDGNRKTRGTMTSLSKLFLHYLLENDLIGLRPDELERRHIQGYIDHMIMIENLAPKTIQNRISAPKSIYSHLQDREIVQHNPFKNKFNRPKVKKTSRNMAFDPDQVSKIKDHCLAHDEGIWNVCQFVYYTYLRPIELQRMKVKHVLLDQGKLFVPAEISKNRNDAFVMIPEALAKMLEGLNLNEVNEDWYLFGLKGKPAPKPVGRETFGKRHRKVLDALNFPKEYTFYSWKHTGVVNAYKAGVDLKSIQLQCRHSSIEQTDTYLKSLGFIDNDSFSKGIPEI